MRSSANLHLGCFIAALLVCSGCRMGTSSAWKYAKNLDVRRAMGFKADESPPPEIPLRVVSSWTDTVLNKTGQRPQRGFGGRLTFFGEDRESPVRVDGQLVVYAFEETEGQPRDTQPTRRYVFPRDQFVQHESESNIGPSYSVWLPWDAVGGERKNISLIVRFEPHGGPLIVGEQTRHLLPGKAVLVDSETEDANSKSNIRLAQHASAAPRNTDDSNIAAEQKVPPKQNLSTNSIPLSKNWERRLSLTQTSKSNSVETSPPSTERESAPEPQPAPQQQ